MDHLPVGGFDDDDVPVPVPATELDDPAAVTNGSPVTSGYSRHDLAERTV